MARHSSDRDDLMAEIITYSPRVSLSILSFPEEIVAGKRSDGRWSVFFGGDPVYHFDADNLLRRAFFRDQLYRSQGQTLCRLRRHESETETVLLRHDLSESELAEFRAHACELFALLHTAIVNHEVTVLNAVPADADFLRELARMTQIVLQSGCPLSPAVKRG